MITKESIEERKEVLINDIQTVKQRLVLNMNRKK